MVTHNRRGPREQPWSESPSRAPCAPPDPCQSDLSLQCHAGITAEAPQGPGRRWTHHDNRQAPHAKVGSADEAHSEAMTNVTSGQQFQLGQGLRAAVLTTADETDGRHDLIEGRQPPGEMTALHLHRRYEERIWVIDGEAQVWAGDQHAVLRSGDFVHIGLNVPHAIKAGEEGLHALNITSPAGFAELVARAGTPAEL